MTYANPTINPLIYAFSNENFKKSFTNIFPFLCRTNTNDNPNNGFSRAAYCKNKENGPEKEVLFEK
jgi:hypothetical protein